MLEAACDKAQAVLLDQAENVLSPNPAIGRPGRVLGTREFVIAGLPYIIAYRVREKDLEILRVLHTSRRGKPVLPGDIESP